MVRDLKWLQLDWDEGPDIGGPHGPYRQSERTAIYKECVDKLVEQGFAYPCFCTDEELDQMKKEAEEQKLPPIYRGKWATANKAEVDEMLAKGIPCSYRFRVPKNEVISIQDLIRGEVSWNTDTLGDFVVLRSNGQPVYNFCVVVDDALMNITHVIRAEEHLPNTLRQMLLYRALGHKPPTFGHVSLILAPDKTKLSKRHGATSVGEFRSQGFLPDAMINYLSLLGWNDGTEQEIYTVSELSEKFSLERITKSPAVFDLTKLSWMNGQHLKGLAPEQFGAMIAAALVEAGLARSTDSAFATGAAAMVAKSLERLGDAPAEVSKVLAYPLEQTLASEEVKPVLEDDFKSVVDAVLAADASGELAAAIQAGHDGFKKFANAIGKAQKRKGKRLFMPLRVAFTGAMAGPDVGDVLALLASEDNDVKDRSQLVTLSQRMQQLKAWRDAQA